VTLRVGRGEMVALLGPNGAGKSTLLKLAGGVLRPRHGQVLLAGDDVRALPRAEAARRVAVVPQDFSVQFAYTVRQLVEIGRMPHMGRWGIARAGDHTAVAAALVAARLEPLADRIFNELSGGERQRVLVAMALAQGSPILLLDEPTAHLDIRHQIEMLDLLRDLNASQGLTVIAALHDLNLAARYFPRLVLFQRGVVADGPPTAVLDPALLGRVYQTPVQVGILRGEEHLSVLPPGRATVLVAEGTPSAGANAGDAAPRPRVHVLAGGGAGEIPMRALADGAIPFTAGPLNTGDSDHALALRLAVRCLAEPPAAPVSPEGLAAARAAMADAGLVLVCPFPIGPGNLALLEAALDARRAGQRVVLLADGPAGSDPAVTPEDNARTGTDLAATMPDGADLTGADREALLARVRARDFTGGRAADLYADLLAAGAEVAPDALVVVRASAGGW
jgi:iron complex transport system ATP-binding protein